MAVEPGLHLILGPSGGGKSRWAEHLAATSGMEVTYIATGPCLPADQDWQQKLDKHRRRRPSHWSCLEVEGALQPALQALDADPLILVDSLGTWVAAWLAEDQVTWCRRCDGLVNCLATLHAPLLLVAEEVGWSVVPSTAEGSRFRQRLTGLLQRLQPQAVRTWLVVADRAIDLDRLGHVVPPSPDPGQRPVPAAI